MSDYRGYKRDGSTGLYVPEKLAKKIGMGCPKCDDHFLQDFDHGRSSAVASAFVGKHIKCGTLESLELIDGVLKITGPVELRIKSN